MPMRHGTLIVPLDCEGKWGMADHLSAHHATFITNRNLARVYSELLRAFERRKLRVTFAFVDAFTMEIEAHEPDHVVSAGIQ